MTKLDTIEAGGHPARLGSFIGQVRGDRLLIVSKKRGNAGLRTLLAPTS